MRCPLCPGDVYYWDLVESQVVKRFVAHNGVVCSLAMHPEGKQMLTSSLDGVVKVWTTKEGLKAAGKM
jgi:mitogen-activated protein kinase organizer 1